MTGKPFDEKDYAKICRTCLCPGELKCLFESKVFHTLINVTNIEIDECDKLPRNICSKCVKQLEDIALFIDTCKTNDLYLKQILEENDTTIENNFEGNFNWDAEESKETFENILTLKEVGNFSIKLKRKRGRPPKNSIRQERDKVNFKRKRVEECSCDTCGRRFSRWGGLQRHMKIHLGIKPFECDICGKHFVEKATLNRHNLIHTDEKPFECNLCAKVFRRKDQITDHIQKHHPNATNFDFVITEHKTTTDKEIKIEKEEHLARTVSKEEKFQQTEDKKFKTKKRIEICLCNLCGKVFRRRGYLKNHMAIHAKTKPFECGTCGKGFTQKHALTRHNLVHTKERPFQCNLCGKTFTRKEILTEHIKNHDGSKPHLCFHCGKCFTTRDYLKKHLKYYLTGNQNNKNFDKTCICPHCGKQLHSVAYLKTHLLTHTGEKPFECKICGNRFTIQRSLNHHLNIHKGIKPYQCVQCEKAFRTTNSLKKHSLLHTGERPYKCTSCDKGFIRRSHLKRHFRTH